MVTSSALYHLWKRQVFLRNRHRSFDALISKTRMGSGIYLIGCNGKVVYVGQTWNLAERPIQSLGNIYHRVSDPSLPWSIAFAPCPPDEMDEQESTAIRMYAPRFNTSIPSIAKSQGKMPTLIGAAAVFQDQDGPCGAFRPESLLQQMDEARVGSDQPWKTKRRRKSTPKRWQNGSNIQALPFEWPKESADELVAAYGVPLSEPLRFKINLCKDGSVITEDGEIIGTWTMDENEHPSFFPDGSTEATIFDVFIGSFCSRIEEWHTASSSLGS